MIYLGLALAYVVISLVLGIFIGRFIEIGRGGNDE
jgi:uncharacterized protein YneF (UPF0154 family)